MSGTEGDLRKMKEAHAREFLLKRGFTEKSLKSLQRWQLIDHVRRCSFLFFLRSNFLKLILIFF